MDPKIKKYSWYYSLSIVISLLGLITTIIMPSMSDETQTLLSCLVTPLYFLWFFIGIYIVITLIRMSAKFLYLSVPIISILEFIYAYVIAFGLLLIMSEEKINELMHSNLFTFVWVPIYLSEIALALYILLHKDTNSKEILDSNKDQHT